MEQGIVLESVWVAVGFIVFIALVWRKVSTALGSMLDERSEKISSELKEADFSPEQMRMARGVIMRIAFAMKS